MAAFSVEKLALVDRPMQGRQLALSPDGKRLAYTTCEGDELRLVIADFDGRTHRVVPLGNGEPGSAGQLSDVKVLRWATPDRLVVVGSAGDIFSVDENGRNGVVLWDRNESGLVNDGHFKDEPYSVYPQVPRLLAPLSNDPAHVLVESIAAMGPEQFANAWRIDVKTGQRALVAEKDYPAWQIALYGRGDMLLWPPWPGVTHVDPDLTFGTPVRRMYYPATLDQMLTVMDVPSDWTTIAKFSMIMKNKSFSASGVRPTPFVARLKIENAIKAGAWDDSSDRSDVTLSDAYHGAAVPPDASSGGRMLYDHQGWPRVHYTEFSDGSVREFRYAKPGQFPFDPDGPLPTLDEVLGQTKGKEFTVSADNYFGERSYPLAFDFDPNILYIASNVGRDTYGIYALNLTTKERRELAPGIKGVDLASGDPTADDEVLVFDEARQRLVGIRYRTLRAKTYWLDADLAEEQARLDAKFPRHAVEISAWDQDRRRYIVRVAAEDDPGAVFLYDPAGERLEKLFSATPWMADRNLNASTSFAFRTPAGVDLSGYLTLPDAPKITPSPVVVYLQADLWHRAPAGFDVTAEMLADMGCAVLRLNYRGSPGFGREYFAAIKAGIAAVPAEDVFAALDWLGSRMKIDRKHVVLVGEGLGGYIAMQIAADHSEEIRAVVAIDAPTSLAAWTSWQQISSPLPMFRNAAVEAGTTQDFHTNVRRQLVAQIKDPAKRPAARNAALHPATLVVESAGSGETTPLASFLAGLGLGDDGLDVRRLRLNGDFHTGSTATRTKVFQGIEEFFNLNLYEFGTSIGPLKVIEDPSKK